MTKTKKDIKRELKEKGHVIRGHCWKEELNDLAKLNDIALTYETTKIEEGWLGKPKGLLQVLWERGWINEKKKNEYSLKGKASQMNDKGKLKPEFICYRLRTLMSNCADFKEEKSAMEVLLQELSTKSLNNHRLKRKDDRKTDEMKLITKSKADLKNELKDKGYYVREHYAREKIERLAKDHKIELTCQIEVIEEGWVVRPKGLLQVLWERGWIDERRISE